MLLSELFSPVGGPKEQGQDINWVGDFKTYLDNDNEVLSNQLFPVIKKHQKYPGHPDAYKLYVKPLIACRTMYQDKFKVDDCESKITKQDLIAIAKQMATEQDQFIQRGDYED